MAKVSIIVPVYKTEKYINRCVDSILTQTFQDFELILVDDGSPDNCPAICDEYAAKDHRVQVIHKPNGGVSSARNAGLDAACGKYIMFCDSDDTVSRNWCEQHYLQIKQHPDFWIVSNINRISADGTIAPICILQRCAELHSYFEVYINGLSPYVCNKIYQVDIIRNSGIKFDENICMGEDIAFNTAYFAQCNGIQYISEPLYNYYDTVGASTNRYYWNLLELNLKHFETRLPLIGPEKVSDFCDIYLFQIIHWLDNVMDSRNPMSFCQKMRFNQKMMQTDQFKFCLENASAKKENPVTIKVLRTYNYYLYWIFQKLVQIKK